MVSFPPYLVDHSLTPAAGKGQIDNTSLAWPALIQRMYNSGHQIASHTWSHPDLCNITSAQRKNEMYKNEMALRNILGVIPTYMRPPYSSCTAGEWSIPSRTFKH